MSEDGSHVMVVVPDYTVACVGAPRPQMTAATVHRAIRRLTDRATGRVLAVHSIPVSHAARWVLLTHIAVEFYAASPPLPAY